MFGKNVFFGIKRGDIPEDFKFGCPEYKQFHYDRYNPEYVDTY